MVNDPTWKSSRGILSEGSVAPVREAVGGEVSSASAGVPAAIRLVDVVRTFRGGKDVVLNGLHVEFPQGQLTYILGGSGAGKSVLLKHILGLMRPDRGEIWVNEQNVVGLQSAALKDLRRQFGMLFQNSALFDDQTVYDNVAFPLREHTELSEAEIEAKVVRSLTWLGMRSSDLRKFPNELSGGMKKRVGLARAIIREPSILLYDEPTTGLDPVTRVTVDELIETLKRELRLTSLVISHDIGSALRLADRICFLSQGRMLFQGTPQAFVESEEPAIQKFLDAERQGWKAFQHFL